MEVEQSAATEGAERLLPFTCKDESLFKDIIRKVVSVFLEGIYDGAKLQDYPFRRLNLI